MEPSVTMTGTAVAVDSVTQLKIAHGLVSEHFDPDEPLTRAALHLIDCAADVVGQLPAGDLDAAREALGSARAAVISATYAVRRIHDFPRTEQE
ncbi:hypothetical protein [Nocardiopsis ansamitocini]|uniref:Uncharacterized protein n=1 Tax=Nocardiopsis ansamitocini TaxID=1670832 RepID=A0A9W6UIC6_9ACTN|nr:hypothetical protein [Nocardiopsis ansamitocini]GLU49801.1 hypothetical protein Nans01_41520 [Nocardiopsis ansamitocini]